MSALYCRSVFRLFVLSSHLGLELECDKKTDNIKWLMELFQWEYITATIHWPLKATFCTEKALSATFLRNWWDHFNIMCPIKWNLSICPTIKYLRLQNLLELTSQKSFAFMKFWMLIKAPPWPLNGIKQEFKKSVYIIGIKSSRAVAIFPFMSL